MEVICLQSLNIYFGLLEKNLEDFCLEESMKQAEFFWYFPLFLYGCMGGMSD